MKRQDRQAVAIAMVAGLVGVMAFSHNETFPVWAMAGIVIGWWIIVIGLVVKE